MRINAIRIIQPSGRAVYSFALTTERLATLSRIAHVGRDAEDKLVGYQRPEQAAHIRGIRSYLEQAGAVLPNTIVVGLTRDFPFTGLGQDAGDVGELGWLDIEEDGTTAPFVLIDGQQRFCAASQTNHDSFPLMCSAMVAEAPEEQATQFVLVNNTKPLPRGLIQELLPYMTKASLPKSLGRDQIAATLIERLNLTPGSALFRKIKTPTCPDGDIKDNTVRRFLKNSLSDGVLFEIHRAAASDEEAIEKMIGVISTFWEGVQYLFPQAWALPPKSSRLTHGAGFVALGYQMDELYTRGGAKDAQGVADFLAPLTTVCAWTSGNWDFGYGETRAWNLLQNTDRETRMLASMFRRVLRAK